MINLFDIFRIWSRVSFYGYIYITPVKCNYIDTILLHLDNLQNLAKRTCFLSHVFYFIPDYHYKQIKIVSAEVFFCLLFDKTPKYIMSFIRYTCITCSMTRRNNFLQGGNSLRRPCYDMVMTAIRLHYNTSHEHNLLQKPLTLKDILLSRS